MIRVDVLGPLVVTADGSGGRRRVDVGDRRRRSLLAMLTLGRGAVVSTGALVEGLWPRRPPAAPVAALQAHVSHLRRSLEPDLPPRARTTVIAREPPGYVLRLPEDAVDAWRFEDIVIAATGAADADVVVRDIDHALALWRGPAYAEVADEPWAAAAVSRLDELRVVAQERWCAAALARGRATDAVLRAQRLTRSAPLREEGWRLLALALYADGRQAEALDALRQARTTLAEELGLDPGPALSRLETDILEQREDLLGVSAEPVSAASRRSPAENGFVGRTEEMAALRATADRARSTRTTQVVLVAGDPGAGKSALLRRLGDELSERGWRVVRGRSPESGAAPPASAWAEVVRRLAEHVDPGPLTPALVPLLQDDVGPTEVDQSYGRFELARAVTDFVATCARRRPLAVLLDDLHRADSETMALTASVVDRLRDAPLLIVGAYRQRELNDRAATSLDALAAAHTAGLALQGLGPGSAAALVRAVAGPGHDSQTIEALVDRAGGNPYFLQEWARLLHSEGAAVATAQVPVGVRDVLRARVARLPVRVLDLLRLAAVVGRDVDLEVLVAAGTFLDRLRPAGDADLPDHVVLDAVEVAEDAGLLVTAGPGRVRFAHVLVCDTLYDDMPESRRTRLHAAVAAAIGKHRPADVAGLAHHLYRSGTAAAARAALDAARAAAEQAMARYAPEVAVELYEQAVQALGRLDPPGAAGSHAAVTHDSERVHLLSRLGVAQLAAGAGQAALVARAAAIGAAERSGDDGLLVSAVTAWDLPTPWTVEPYGTWDRHLTSLIERSLTVADLADATRCRLLYALVREVAGHDQGRARDAATQAEQLARQLDAPLLLGLALHARGVALLHDGDMAGRLPLADELVEIGQRRGLAVFALLGHEFVVQAAATRGDVATLADRIEQLTALVRTYRWQQAAGMVEMHRGLLAHIGALRGGA